MGFHDLASVETLGAPGPSKSGVECLDFVGLKVFCSKRCFWFCKGRFGVSQKCVYKIWSPKTTRSFFWGMSSFCLKMRVALYPIIVVKTCIVLNVQYYLDTFFFRWSHVQIWIWMSSLDTCGYFIQKEWSAWSPKACNPDMSGFF